MTSFTRTFGGQVVNPAQLSYATYTQATSLSLEWAFQTPADGNVIAYQTEVAFTTGGLSVTMPDASLVSTGTSALITNTGSFTFTVLANDGLTVLGSISSGQSWYFYITINTTPAGTWHAFQFGVGTSSASAASLAGAGLIAAATKLNQNLIVVPKPDNYSPVVGDLATVLQGTGGSVVWTPGSASAFGNGWFVYVINDGSGTLTWTPSGGQLIDGQATKVFQPTESAAIFSDGTNFWSFGYGRAPLVGVSGVTIDLTGSGTLNLTASQAASQVQDFTGALTGNRLVQYGTGVGFWFVRNATTGASTVTFAVNGGDPGVVVSQGSYSILRSNGTNMEVAFTATSGTVTNVATTSDLTGGPITTTGTLGLSTTGVISSTYGDAANVPQIAISSTGRITSATNVALGTSAAINASAAAGIPDANLMLKLDSKGQVPSINGGWQTGDVMYSFTTSKAGWLLCNTLTIGDASSGGTARANADTVNLFTLLWNNLANAQAPVSGGRGVSAAADYAAHKTIQLPDLRGTVTAGLDNLGGVGSAGRLSGSMASTTMGAALSVASTTSVALSGTAFTNGLGVSGTAFTSGLNTIGTISANSVSGLAFGGGGFASEAGDRVDTIVQPNAGVSGSVVGNAGVSGSTSGFNIAQSTMVMNAWIKL